MARDRPHGRHHLLVGNILGRAGEARVVAVEEQGEPAIGVPA